MAIGTSGRIVIEIEPELKRLLHTALQKEGLTLKDWFRENARQYVYEGKQLTLDFSGAGEPINDINAAAKRVEK